MPALAARRRLLWGGLQVKSQAAAAQAANVVEAGQTGLKYKKERIYHEKNIFLRTSYVL